MGTIIRPELSKKNPYWIERHRYYELKHFCMQYPIWKESYRSLLGLRARSNDLAAIRTHGHIANPTEKIGIAIAYYSDRIDMIHNVALQTSDELADYLVYGITEGISYDTVRARYNIPCGKEMYYELYRKFFWILNKVRG